ncbi:MAG: cellulase family glycosylhydrolase [Aquabacterium sp.]
MAPGWTYVPGVSPFNASGPNWILQNGSNTASTLISSIASLLSGVTTNTYNLQYNFGCGTPNIVLRTRDCRNVPTMYAGADSSKVINPNAAVSFYVRNVDASAQLFLIVKDDSGQSLQYPFSSRTIEAQDPSQWVRVTVPLKYPSGYWGGSNNGIPQGHLNIIEIGASALNSPYPDKGLNYPIGKLEVKGIEWIDTLSTTYKLAPNNAVTTGFDSYAPTIAVAHNKFDAVTLNKAKAVGINAIRKDIFWDAVEINGVFNFSAYTAGMDALNALNMKVLWILDYGHPNHGGSLPPQTAADISAYATYAKKVAQLTASKRNVVGYEIWNEPNIAGFWPSPDPVKYAALLNAARTAIRQADATTPVISGGISVDIPDYLFKLAQTGALNDVSAIGVHPYRPDIVTTSNPYKRTANTPENYASEIIVQQNALKSLGVNTPMWNTEWGYSTYFFLDAAVYGDGNSAAAATRQGLMTVRMVLTQLAMKSPLITIFRLVDTGTDPTEKEDHFGLLKPDLTEKPAYTGLKTLYQHSGGRKFKGYLTDAPTGMHVLRWDGDTDRAFCAWADDQGRPVALKLPANVNKVTRWDGTVLTPATGADGYKSVTLREEDGPVFVLFR